jgi:hypothetical protein
MGRAGAALCGATGRRHSTQWARNLTARAAANFSGIVCFSYGVQIGNLVGPKEDHYSPSFKLEGEALDTQWAHTATNYALSSTTDAAYRAPQAPLQVFRKSNPQMWEWTDKGVEEGTTRHEIYLKLPRPLTPGQRYSLNSRRTARSPRRFRFSSTTRACEPKRFRSIKPVITRAKPKKSRDCFSGSAMAAALIFRVSTAFKSWTTKAETSLFAAT